MEIILVSLVCVLFGTDKTTLDNRGLYYNGFTATSVHEHHQATSLAKQAVSQSTCLLTCSARITVIFYLCLANLSLEYQHLPRVHTLTVVSKQVATGKC